MHSARVSYGLMYAAQSTPLLSAVDHPNSLPHLDDNYFVLGIFTIKPTHLSYLNKRQGHPRLG
ncbi:hypothetical protein PCANC_18380 [Puccinia coronata f. sp. avenae]|uniref:Uncharacterized protein n=1 Tax=Puccinia coronata f. sp. avenae TaxID=200324 RepID=A0A2N5V1F2_9BASI|nr:hypothetical protein PCANC_18380 [Puccinia coronata f. sp. avenae]